MKKLLFILALLPIGLMGQTGTLRLLSTRPDPPTRVQIDTVAVWINCTDTAGRWIGSNYSIKGYEIIHRVESSEWGMYRERDSLKTGWIPYFETIGYLNYFRKPLTGYLVWETRKIK
jgi:hypothetical protein